MTRESGGEDRHRHDEPSPQSGDGGVAAHHLPVGEDVRPADVEGPVDVGRHAGGADEVAQYVADADRLGARVHPTGGHHDRQALGEIAQHLERGRARSDDDRGPEHRGRHRPLQEDPPDLGPGAQVGGEGTLGYARRGESAQVDDPPDPGGVRLLGEDPGGPAVGVLEARAGAEGVHQVVGHVDPAHGLGDGRGVRDIAAHRLDVLRPGMIAQLAGGAGQTPDPVTGPQQLRHQPAADVSGRPGDQAEQSLAVRLSILVRHHCSPHPSGTTCLSCPMMSAVR